uniref:Putative integral to membrane n=1 Tax=Corethrella appendiculata TaxID=1370023 RepID=U5ETU5_9DIPT
MTKDVEFHDVNYIVMERRNITKAAIKRELLTNVSGVFRQGQLSAIMGPSGAGKSSLLNAISGYRKAGVNGTIHINKKASCYITQEDFHQPLLTIEELMRVAYRLKVNSGHDFDKVSTDILTNLHLDHRRNLTADRLSGGERKRLSIALELVANPTILFLDEPTSGLDEVTAASCIRLLQELARQGRTIVCTIHQPSAAIFQLFDNIFILAQGRCVYQGSPKTLIPFLSYYNLECPKHYNPADYIIELCDSESKELIENLSNIFDGGKLTCKTIDIASQFDETSILVQSPTVTTTTTTQTSNTRQLESNIEFVLKPIATSMILEKRPQISTLIQKLKKISKFFHNKHATSGIMQFYVLFSLMMLKIVRNRTVLWIQLIHHLTCGIFIGLIFLNSANEGERMFDHLKYCLGVIFFTVYTQMMTPILSYPFEVKLVKKECFNRWYGLLPYYLALNLSRIPLQVLLNFIFSALVYYLAGLPYELQRFCLFLLIGNLVSFVAEGLGLLIGATFNVTNGTAIGPMMMAPFLGLAIYGFDFAPDIPFLMNSLMRFSFIRGGVVSMVLVVFGFNREQLSCNELYCHFDNPKVLLRYLRIEQRTLYGEAAYLIGIMITFRLLFYLSLRRRFFK